MVIDTSQKREKKITKRRRKKLQRVDKWNIILIK
jgi:hypothetical protein